MPKARGEPVSLSREAGPMRSASRLDNSNCMERLSSESACVQTLSVPVVLEEELI